MGVTNEDVLQKGVNQVAAGYILYGSSTILVYTTVHGVYGFTLEPSLGEFVLSHTRMTYPKNGTIYSVNEGYLYKYQQEIQQFINQCKTEGITARYVGSLVADFHRNLLKGGIYLYPSMEGAPDGKLRLMYECNALAFIAEQSGGIATNGTQRILEIEPKTFHQRSPFYIGSENLIERLLSELE